MNQNIQDIADKVDDNILAKADPGADPAKILATDHAEILNDILVELDNLVSAAAPVNPTGTSWYIAPGTPTIAANVITETASTVAVTTEVSTTLYPITSQAITVPYAASGFKRIDAIVTAFVQDLELETEYYVYDRIEGAEVDELGIAATPLLNPANMFVRWIHVSDGDVAAGPSGAVYSVSINGGTPNYPGPTGNIDLIIDAGPSYTDAEAIAAAKTNIGTGATNFAAGNHTHANATTSTAGFMSAADKTKLDAAQTDSATLFLTPETSPQEFPVYGKFLTGSLQTFNGSASGNYSFKWKTDGGTYSSAISTIASLTTALSGLTDTSKTWIEVTSTYANASSVIIKWTK